MEKTPQKKNKENDPVMWNTQNPKALDANSHSLLGWELVLILICLLYNAPKC